MQIRCDVRQNVRTCRTPQTTRLESDPPDQQGTGIGAALVRAVAERVDAAEEPLLVLEGSPAYYGRLGFEPAAAHGITITLPDWAPPEAAQVLRLHASDPTMRGHVVYPPAFAEH